MVHLIDSQSVTKSSNLPIPNILTCSRIGFAFLIYVLLIQHFILLALIFYGIALLTDILDGYFARYYHQINKNGLYLDSGADFVLLITIYCAYAQMHQISWFYFLIFVFMYIQFLISNSLGIRTYDKWGKYLGTIHMIVQIFLLIQVSEFHIFLLSITVYVYSGICLISRYQKLVIDHIQEYKKRYFVILDGKVKPFYNKNPS